MSVRAQLQLGPIQIDRLAVNEALDCIIESASKAPIKIAWVYANCLNIALENAEYAEALNASDFVLNDGIGIELASKFMGQPVLENLCGTDLIPKLLDKINSGQNQQQSIFLLGSTKAVLHRAIDDIQSRWPNIQITGSHHGYFDDSTEMIDLIRKSKPSIILVSMGVPKQELWIYTHWQELKEAGIRLAIPGGAILDYITGTVDRAPVWVRKLRLEWLYRVFKEPRRLWKRYLVGNLVFIKNVLQIKFRSQA